MRRHRVSIPSDLPDPDSSVFATVARSRPRHVSVGPVEYALRSGSAGMGGVKDGKSPRSVCVARGLRLVMAFPFR
jgi:hypothetical protein